MSEQIPDSLPVKNHLFGLLRQHKVKLAMAVLLIFYSVGFWGLALSGNAVYFQNLTPLNLLLTNAILFSFHRDFSPAFLLFAVVVMLAGFLAEVLGVHTGLLFGEYSYGQALGLKLWDVPLLIALNWLMLTYGAGSISRWLQIHWLGRAALAALLMLALDYLIEPVALRFDFWSWHSGEIPLTNYLGWLGLAFLLQVLYHRSSFRKTNPLAAFVFCLQAAFFLALNIFN